MGQENQRATNHRLKLLEMKAGEQGTVTEILGGIGLRQRLEAMGVRPGVKIEKMTGSPFGGPVVIKVRRVRFAIGSGMAGKVIVEVEGPGTS